MSDSPSLTAAERGLVQLFRRFPPRDADVIFKESAGRASSEYQAEITGPPVHWYLGLDESMFAGRDVLDVGSGFGGRSVRFLEYGARSVVGVELDSDHTEEAATYARERGVEDRVTFRIGKGEELPAEDESFDLIVMFDVMEHVYDVGEVLNETFRVLRP